jgi:hypothetical protein
MGTYNYTGSLTVSVSPLAAISFDFAYVGGLTVSASPAATIDPNFAYVGSLTVSATLTSQEQIVYTAGFPYINKATVIIDGRDYSGRLHESLRVSRQDNAAATFDLTIYSEIKPVEFLNREITITFEAGTANGVQKNIIDVFKGQVKRVNYNQDSKIFQLSGYDYGGVHGEDGQLVSTDITTVLEGAVYIDSPGTYNLAQDPIWGVYQVIPDGNIVDGRDFFVNPLAGKIEVPATSNFITTPGSLKYSYSNYFDNMLALLQAIAGEKGWAINDTAVTLLDYSDKKKQPVLSLSDESIIDVLRKFLELSGAKVETNLYPELRLYSEVDNFVTRDHHLINEKIIYENSLNYDIDFSDVINSQVVKSAGKQFSNIALSSSEEIKTGSGQTTVQLVAYIPWHGSPSGNQDSQQQAYEKAYDIYAALATEGQKVSVRFETGAKGSEYQTLSIVPTGTLYRTASFAQATIRNIVSADWVQSFDEGDIIYELKIDPLLELSGAVYRVFYPGAIWGLTVSGAKIAYGEGTIEDIVEVTATRSINGVSETLRGDTYENPYIETAAQAGALGNAILNTRGNFYDMSCQIPLHESLNFEIGNRLQVEQNKSKQFIGNIKQLNYTMNYNSGQSFVGVSAQGIGNNI